MICQRIDCPNKVAVHYDVCCSYFCEACDLVQTSCDAECSPRKLEGIDEPVEG
jgi:hypothetical protein